MIPALKPMKPADEQRDAFLSALKAAGFEGDCSGDEASTTVYATDNSIYQVAPQAILFPHGKADLVRIARLAAEPRFSSVKLAARGGGTGTNGQSLSDGIVIDMSRHMNRILSIDPAGRRAVVEAGVVKDQLNRALAPHGLFFAPELSTSNRATIGGMINTDACGQGSCLYGKTSNHVLALHAVLVDGTELDARLLGPEALKAEQLRDDRIGRLYRQVDAIERESRPHVAAHFPKLNRFLTGYDLDHLRSEDDGLNLAALLCGAEGTLALIAEAELNLMPIPRHTALINLRYDDFGSALTDARLLAGLGVASVETVDGRVLGLARGDMIWPRVSAFFPDDASGPAQGINIVEVLADEPEALRGKIMRIEARLTAEPGVGRRAHTIAMDRDAIEGIWAMRKRAVGLLGNVNGARRPLPFVEDTAVPPEHLADYIAEFRALLDAEGLDYGMFGHVDAGVLHVRPALDLSDPSQEPLIRKISDAVFALTRKYGGVLWGEHGKGVRSEYVPEMFGPLYPALQSLKAAFDPNNQLNPGKIATPGRGELARIDEVALRGSFDRQIDRPTREAFDNATHCNGNGACFDFDADSAMCPSFKATGDRRFSPKGRASLIREWLRRLAELGVDPRKEALNLRSASKLRTLPARLRNSLRSASDGDFSHRVREALDTCLACKACAGQCPIKVNVPAFRAKFLELYYGRYLRPLKDPLVASIEHLLPLLRPVGAIYNLLVGSSLGRSALSRLGLTALPVLPGLSLERELHRRGMKIARAEHLAALSAADKARSVVIVQDAFTSSFEPQLVLDLVDLLLAFGFRPYVAPLRPNGKALHVHGYLGAFERNATRRARELRALAASGVALVGIDPSMTLCYRQEYAASLEPGAVPQVSLLQEWLAGQTPHLDGHKLASDRRYCLLPHCTERTNAAASISDWGTIFRKLGLSFSVAEAGCCGMAGTFGHETRNRGLSERIFELSWAKKLKELSLDEVPMATGYSCRSQAKLKGENVPRHPIQILKELLSR
ncbi:MAG: FAD-binding oxidoreductase [Bosea sp.]|uniref:D-2-hydroxyglutarate dehydrogenase YdiJ n=1 Tax=Bosea sp. (in: a-proteobacteria) TaxID=1871050 RepID=UPI001AC8796C|nr:FAD-binding and (Fe-S)-binding domain-containing protein [Bosea sp. (in: a-proteobacteria)]MBN9451297.1 FAD-binding oxidoreductase [Bosea sp. (in: a-proteobacteria)]